MTFPGALYAVPEGTMCDDHPARPATHRLQGETDSFGSEMHDLCDECAKDFKVYKPDECDWCKQKADDCRATRDYEEGLYGPVYYVCKACRDKRAEREREELEASGFYDDWNDDYDDDTYEAERHEIYNDIESAPPPPRKIAVSCRCGKPWTPGHKCHGRVAFVR